MRIIYALALSLSLMGCSFGKDSSGNSDKRELEEQAKAEAEYNRVVGKYAGQLNLGYTKYDMELELFTVPVESTIRNPDGSPKLTRELRGNYKKIRPAGTGYNFKSQFYPTTGKLLLMSTEKEENIGPDDIHSIELSLSTVVRNGVSVRQLKGVAKGIRGTLGQFESLYLITQEQSDKPDSNEQEQDNARLRAEFKKIEGIYEGLVKQDPRVGAPIAVSMRLYIQNDGANSKRPPVLKGKFVQDDGGDIEFDLQTVYKPELNPPQLTAHGKVMRAPGSDMTVTIDGGFTKVKVGNEMRDAFVGHAQYSSLAVDGDCVLIKQPVR